MFRRKPVIHRNDRATACMTQGAAQGVMGVDASHHKTTAMKKHQQGQHALLRPLGGIQARTQAAAITPKNSQILYPLQRRRLWFKHTAAHGIGFSRQIKRQVLHGRTRFALNATQKITNTRLQALPGLRIYAKR